METAAPLSGWRVIVPRGGEWGERVSAALIARGADPIIVPLIETEYLASAELTSALRALVAGDFDWLAVTSAVTAGLLDAAAVPPTTRVAAVGPSTARALDDAGVAVSFVPQREFSARGMLEEWPAGGRRALLLQSEIAAPTLANGLAARGLDVHAVTAYRTRTLAVSAKDRSAFEGSHVAALVTSGSVARALAAAAPPATLVVVCIGPETARAAREAGLAATVTAAEADATSLIEALTGYAAEAARRKDDR